MKRVFFIAVLMGLGLSALRAGTAEESSGSTAAVSPDEAESLAAKAYIYGFPLVIMDTTRRVMTNVPAPLSGRAPINRFAHMRQFPTAEYRSIVRPNVDTLYSSAWLDLSQGPVVLSVPDTKDRYYLMPMLDAWTNVFASPGKRTTGTKAADFVITPPGWKGELPAGMREIKAPQTMVWILGRTQTNGPDDYEAVHAIQDQFRLTPLGELGNPQRAKLFAKVNPNIDVTTSPFEQVASMDAQAFFGSLASLLAAYPPAAEDSAMLKNLARLGVTPGRPFDLAKLDPAVAKEMESVVRTAPEQLEAAAREIGKFEHGWNIPPKDLGQYGDDYVTRAIVAAVGIGANLTADALYPTAFVDGDEKPLNGDHRYTIHFNKGQTPPANALWSITLYGPDSFLVANPINRYAINSWMPLKFHDDGSLDLFIQRESPGEEHKANWLPAPQGEFNLTMRMYWPQKSALKGEWKPPAVTQVAP